MWIRTKPDRVILTCRVRPNASVSSLEGVKEDQLHIRLASPPVEGKANQALIKFLSKQLKLPQSKIDIIQGEKARLKVLSLADISEQEVRERLGIVEG